MEKICIPVHAELANAVKVNVNCTICYACGGFGKLKAKRKAMQFNGPPVDYDTVVITCPICNGKGTIGGSNERD